MSKSISLHVKTGRRDEFIDITLQVQQAVRNMGIEDGYVVVFVPHTTAGVTINENADPDVRRDLIKQLDEMVPWENGYAHYEGNTAAHLKSSMMGFSETVLVENGRLLLGTWQGIYFTEFDGPRSRRFVVKGFEA